MELGKGLFGKGWQIARLYVVAPCRNKKPVRVGTVFVAKMVELSCPCRGPGDASIPRNFHHCKVVSARPFGVLADYLE